MVRIFVLSWILVTFRFADYVEAETFSRERRLFLHRPITERCDHQIIYSGPGLITSPNFGSQQTYPSNTLCDWHIAVPVGQVIRLHFTALNIQATNDCTSDYLLIFDGSDSIARKLARLCGDVIPLDIVTTQHEIFFFFRSDDLIEGLGFNLTYSAEEPSKQSITLEACKGYPLVLNSSHGVVSSPYYDGINDYPPGYNCSWLIQASYGRVITLSFLDFRVERMKGCIYDHLSIYDGNSSNAGVIATLCGLSFPDGITSTGSAIYMNFLSDADVGAAGFNLTYEIHDPLPFCASTNFRCGDRSCVGMETLCNRTSECTDGSDEQVCDCLSAAGIVIFTTSRFIAVFNPNLNLRLLVQDAVYPTMLPVFISTFGNSGKCGNPVIRPSESNFRVVGGREAIPHSWPWMVSLRLRDAHTCGGTLIHPQWVLTAGHCFEGDRVPSDWSAAAGKHLKTKSESYVQVLQLEKIIVHPEYDSMTSDNDIALVKVNSSFTINSLVGIICPPTSPPTVGDTCFVTGWGFVENTCCADVLKQAVLPIQNSSLCNRPDFLYNQVTDNMLCAGYLEGGHDACEGDSGGPFACKINGSWQIHGIVSFGQGCAGPNANNINPDLPSHNAPVDQGPSCFVLLISPCKLHRPRYAGALCDGRSGSMKFAVDPKSPGVYTRVYNYVRWIQQKIAIN